MNKISPIKNDLIYALISYIVISLIILRSILFTNDGVGFNHDWNFPMSVYEFRDFCEQALYIWQDHNLGIHLIYPSQYILQYIFMPLSFLGFSGLLVLKLLLLFIFVFSAYFMYILLQRSLKLGFNASFIGGFFYISTPLVFNKMVAGHYLYLISYALSPLILYYYIKFFSTNNIKYLIISGILIAIASIQIQYSAMLLFLLTLFGFIIFGIRYKVILCTLILAIFICLIHSFWILPDLIAISTTFETLRGASTIENLASWSTSFIEAFVLSGYRSNHFLIALNQYGYHDIWEIPAFILIVIIFSSLIICRNRITLLFGAISVTTLMFTAALSGPFGSIVYFLYSNFAIFNLFRETYHLAFLLSFSYTIMLAYAVFYIYTFINRSKKKTFLFLIFAFSLIIFNNPFMYTGNFNGQIPIYSINASDVSVANFYQNSNAFYRVLYLPMIQPFKYSDLNYYGSDPCIIFSRKPTLGNMVSSDFANIFALDTYMPQKKLNNLLSITSIRYVFIRSNYISMFPYYITANNYILGSEYYDVTTIWKNSNLFKTIQNQQSLTKINETKNTMVYANKNYLPHIYSVSNVILINDSLNRAMNFLTTYAFNINNSVVCLSGNTRRTFYEDQFDNINFYRTDLFPRSDLSNTSYWTKNSNNILSGSTNFSEYHPSIIFRRINPTKYELQINASRPFILVFSESYHPQWKVYIENRSFKFDEIIANYDWLNIMESMNDMRFMPKDISYLQAESLPETNHFEANGYANAWYINKTGTYDITLYFLPQSLFYIGLIISIIFTIFCGTCLLLIRTHR